MVEFEDMSYETLKKAIKTKYEVDIPNKKVPKVEYCDMDDGNKIWLDDGNYWESIKQHFVEIKNEVLDDNNRDLYRYYAPKPDSSLSYIRRVRKRV